IDLVYGNRLVIDAHTRVTGVHLSPKYVTRYHWVAGMVLPQECSFWRRGLLAQVGPLREDLVTISDHELFMRMWRRGIFRKVDAFLGAYRHYPETVSVRLGDLRTAEFQPVCEAFVSKAELLLARSAGTPLFRLQYRLEQLRSLVRGHVMFQRRQGRRPLL